MVDEKEEENKNSRRTKVNRRKCDHVRRIRARSMVKERESKTKHRRSFHFRFFVGEIDLWRWNYMWPAFDVELKGEKNISR